MNPLDQLNDYLGRVESRFRLLAWLRGAAVVAGAALCATFLLVLIANSMAFSSSSVTGSRLALFLALAFAIGFGLAVPLLKLNRRWTARHVEKTFPDFEQRLLTFAERNDAARRDPFLELLAADTAQVAARAEPQQVVSRQWLLGLTSAAAASMLTLGWLVLFAPGFLGHGAGLLWGVTPRIGPERFYDIMVQPGDKTVRRGADQVVTAQLVGLETAKVRLFARYKNTTKWEETAMQPQQGGAAFEFLFAGLADPLDYYVEASGVRSKTFQLSVVDLPAVKRIIVTYRYPKKLGLENAVDDPGGDLRAVVGTEAEVAIETDRPLRNGVIVLNDKDQVALTPGEGNWVRGTVKIEAEGVYHIAALESSERVRLSNDYFIEARAESAPVVRIRRPRGDPRANPVEEVAIEVEAEDDFAVHELGLKYSVNGSPEKSVTLSTRRDKEVSGSTTLYLEDFKLIPGDVVSFYGTARDASSTARTDMFFIEAQPFEREYSQSQQMGGGGGGGEQENRISQRQKEIIAATWNLLRDPKSGKGDDGKFLSDVQSKLRDQAKSLAQRMRSRQLSGTNQEFQSFSKDMEAAGEAMNDAAARLKESKWREALTPEQKALQHLMRAEATFRQIQVAFGGGGGGGGGGGRDLENLFDLELDTEKNQYETGQQSGGQSSRNQEVDEALQKLEQLARRQQELARQQRNGQMSPQQRWQQEMLRREAEQLQRQMQQLSRGQQQQSGQQGQQGQQQGQQGQQGQASGQQQSGQTQQGQSGQQQQGQQTGRDNMDPRVRQALDRIAQATDDMRKAGGQDAASQRAAERLQEAKDLLSGMRKEESGNQVADFANRADKLAEHQKDFERRLRETFGNQLPGQQQGTPQQPGVTQQKAEQLASEKQKMAEELQRLERDMQRAVRELAGTEREASSKLRDALGEIQKDEIGLRMKYGAEYIRRGYGSAASMREAPVTAGLNQLRDRLREAQQALGQGGKKGDSELARALEQVERTRNRLQQAGRGRQNGDQQGNQQGQNGRQGNQPGQQAGNQLGQQGQQPGQGQGQGQQGQGQQGQGDGQGQQSQSGGGQRGGQLGQGGAGGPWNRSGGYSGMNRGDVGAEGRTVDPAEFERAFRETLRDLNATRRDLRAGAGEGQTESAAEIEQLLKELQQLDPKVFTGNPELLQRLYGQVLANVEQLELTLRRELEGQAGGSARTGTSHRVPQGYGDAVAEYFRRLSRGK